MSDKPYELSTPPLSESFSEPTREASGLPAGQEASPSDAAKAEATAVKDSAVTAGKDVAETARSEAGKVAQETKQQAKSLFSSVSDEVSAQAGVQQQRIATQVGSLSRELSGMASGSSEDGPLTDLAQQAGQRGGEIAAWLDEHEPRDVLREVQSFARRRPVAFLVLCGLAGVVAGRLTRGAVAANTELDSPSADLGSQGESRPAGRRALTSDYPEAADVPGPTMVEATTPRDAGLDADRAGGVR